MRVAVLGGSFHPPHLGHAMVASWLLWTHRVEEVWLVPTLHHALDKPLPPIDVRLRLCELLANDLGPQVRVDPIEASLPVPSYTLRTLDALASRHPGVSFRLVVGADILTQTEHWHRWDLILERYPPILVGRQGHPPVEGAPCFPDISSTDIRRRLDLGLPVDHLLSHSVALALEEA
jgi:nicotinate-nucleotide adenylyltransferase